MKLRLFHCTPLKAHITQEQCEANQKRAEKAASVSRRQLGGVGTGAPSWIPLPSARAVSDSVIRDSIEHRFDQGDAALGFGRFDLRCKCGYGLLGSFEADFSRFDIVFVRCNSHDGAQQVIREQMSPNLFVNHVWCFAAEDVHLHGLFNRSYVYFSGWLPRHDAPTQKFVLLFAALG